MLLVELTDGHGSHWLERRIVNQEELTRLNLVAACCTGGDWWWQIIAFLD